MIPRLKPYFGLEEIQAAFSRQGDAVSAFEQSFAKTFGAKYALAFPYGRSALYALLKALSIENAEVIMPAYTCVVVPHAVVISGNIPKFIDITLKDYNMDLALLEEAVTPETKAIIPTHLFGYPMNVDRVNEIASRAGQKIFIIQDCAHSFGATFRGKYVCNEGDAAIFGLNIAKYISSVFGGMLTTNNYDIYERVKRYRDKHFTKPSPIKQFTKLLYLMAVYVAFNNTLYGFVNFLEENTRLLNRFTKYFREDRINFPTDFSVNLGGLEARVGQVQIRKHSQIRQRRREIAEYYNEHLHGIEGIELPPIVEGATYSHYVPRVSDRERLIRYMRKRGIQIGRLIEYSIPYMRAYKKYKDGEYSNSLKCALTTVNLPNYRGLPEKKVKYIIDNLKDIYKDSKVSKIVMRSNG